MVSLFGGARRRKSLRGFVAFIVILSITIYTLRWRRESLVYIPTFLTSWKTAGRGQERLSEQILGGNQVPTEDATSPLDSESDDAPYSGSSESVNSTNDKHQEQEQAVIGKITISFGEPDETYDRAIRSHELHNKIMGYPHYVLREQLMSGLWSKHAYIFSVIVQELSKPEGERLEWVMWLDRDTVLMNPLLPLEEFLPPPNFNHIHLLVTNDHNGLNNGIFILKVNDWALKLFSATLAFRHYRPEVKLKYTEQTAMEEILKDPLYSRSTAIVPQRWFNAYEPPQDKGKLATHHARPGSLLIHFPSKRSGLWPERMRRWMDIADQQMPEWCVPFNETALPAEIEEFWSRREREESWKDIVQAIENKG